MKTWQKISIAFVLTGTQGALAYCSSLYPDLAQIFTYTVLALGGISTAVLGWPAKSEA